MTKAIIFANAFDPDGSDVHFLNQGSFKKVTNIKQITKVFELGPNGSTPLTARIKEILKENADKFRKGNLVFVVATDGQPTNEKGLNDVPSFVELLETRNTKISSWLSKEPLSKVPMSIVACTNDDDSIGYLQELDRKVPFVDVSDDYESERGEIQGSLGSDFAFTLADYIVKICGGPFDPWIDQLDELKLTNLQLYYHYMKKLPDHHLMKERKKFWQQEVVKEKLKASESPPSYFEVFGTPTEKRKKDKSRPNASPIEFRLTITPEGE